jgi:hypothetical protein
METKSASERFARVIETAKNTSSSGEKPMQSEEKDKLFSEVRKVLDLNKNRPADKEASARLVNSFIQSIERNTSDVIRTMESQDKKLMEDTLDAITKLQFKTVDEFKKSLKDINDLASKMIARSESGGPGQLGEIGKELQQQALGERFKAEGLTLEGKDDTFVNRLKQELFGNSKEPGREGTPTKGFREGFKNAGSEFMGGFKKGLTPQSGVLGSIFKSQESRREEIRNETNQSNERLSEVERLKKMFSEAIGSKTETNKSTNNNSTTTSQSTNKSTNNNSTTTSQSTNDNNNSVTSQSTNDNNNSVTNQSANDVNKSTTTSQSTNDVNKSTTTSQSSSNDTATETNQSASQSVAEFTSVDKMVNLTEEQKKILEQQGIKPSSEKDFSYRKDGKPVSMEEINKTLEAKHKESIQPKVKIQSAKGGVVVGDKNDVASILTEIKQLITEIKDKLFKRAGVAPSGKKQLDPSSSVKDIMSRNKVAQAEAEQAAADAQKRAENIDKQNADKASAKVEAKEKSTPKVVIGGTESANSRVTPETPVSENNQNGDEGGGGSLLGGISGAYAGFKSGGQGLFKKLENQRYSSRLSNFGAKAGGIFQKGTDAVDGAVERVRGTANNLRTRATDFVKNRGLRAEQLLDKNGRPLAGAAKQSRIGKVMRDRIAGVSESGKGMFNKASQFIGKNTAKGTTAGKIAESGMGMLSKAKGAISKVAEKGMSKVGGKIATKGAAKIGAKAVGKSLLKKIPIIGAIAGLGFGAMRALQGDFVGAAGEVASGVASTVPGAGTAASFAIDAGLAARDISRAGNEDSTEGSTESVDGARAEGGPVSAKGSYLVGENGPELFTPNTAGSIKTNQITKSNLETGNNTAAANLKEMTDSAREDTAPVINVPPPTVIQQPAAPQQNNGSGSLPMDTVRTEDSSWQRFQNRRSFG